MRNRLLEQILNEKRVDAFESTNSTFAFYKECLNDIMRGTIADMVGDGDVMSDGYEMQISFEIPDQHVECHCGFKDGTYRLCAYIDHEPEHKYQGSTLEELIADVKSIGNVKTLNEKRVEHVDCSYPTFDFYKECLNDIKNGTIAKMIGSDGGEIESNGRTMEISFELQPRHREQLGCKVYFRDGVYRLKGYVDYDPDYNYQGTTLEEFIEDVEDFIFTADTETK